MPSILILFAISIPWVIVLSCQVYCKKQNRGNDEK
jgi:hypothetical protein